MYKNKKLYMKPVFTCAKCNSYFKLYGINDIYVPMNDGWVKRNSTEVDKDVVDFKFGKKGDVLNKRLSVMSGDYDLSLTEKYNMKHLQLFESSITKSKNISKKYESFEGNYMSFKDDKHLDGFIFSHYNIDLDEYPRLPSNSKERHGSASTKVGRSL